MQTRPRGEQLRFESTRTGSHVIDDYMEAVEKGDRTLPDLLSDIFDDVSGALRDDLWEFRIEPTTQRLQVRSGGPTKPWKNVPNGYIFRQRGAWASGTAYEILDAVTRSGAYYICKTAHTSTSTFDASKFVVALDFAPTTLLADIKTVDGAGSGLDADLLDGKHASAFGEKAADNTWTGANTFTQPIVYDAGSNGDISLTSPTGVPGIVGAYNTTLRRDIRMTSAGVEIGVSSSIAQPTMQHVFTPTAHTINGNAVWHAGNDGPGSGLDADTVDGKQASAFGEKAATNTWTGGNTFNANVVVNATFAADLVRADQGGNSGTPAISFSSDPNTGLYNPTADTLAIATGGIERVRVASDGNVGIGTTAPINNLHVVGGAVRVERRAASQLPAYMVISKSASGGGNIAAGDVIGRLRAEAMVGGSFISYGSLNWTSVDLSGNATLTVTNGADQSLITVDPTGNVAVAGTMSISGNATAPRFLATTVGTSTAPSISFLADDNVGLYSPAANTLSITTTGVERFRVDGNGATVTSGTLKVGSSTVWHAGNDGSGSGLDADTVDGKQASAFGELAATNTWTGGNTFTQPINLDAGSTGSVSLTTPGGALGVSGFSGGTLRRDIRLTPSGVEIGISPDANSPTIQHVFTSTAHIINGNTVWHAGNDGPGSSLNADLLDGQHASAFATSGHTHSQYSLTSHTHSQYSPTSHTHTGLTTFFTMPVQTLTSGLNATANHGFGSEPTDFIAFIRCTSADLGYPVGARIPFSMVTCGQDEHFCAGNVWYSSTQIGVVLASTTQFFVKRRDTSTGDVGQLDTSKWQLYVQAAYTSY